MQHCNVSSPADTSSSSAGQVRQTAYDAALSVHPAAAGRRPVLRASPAHFHRDPGAAGLLRPGEARSHSALSCRSALCRILETKRPRILPAHFGSSRCSGDFSWLNGAVNTAT